MNYIESITSFCISYYNDKCNILCSHGQKLHPINQICHSICPKFTDGDYCIDECPNDKVILPSLNECSNDCPLGYYVDGTS